MFRFFEQLTNPFPADTPRQPPNTVIAFCRHYLRGFGKYMALMACLTALIAFLEVMLFDFLGQLVDWLTNKPVESLLVEEWKTLLVMGFVVLVVLPLAELFHSLLSFQTLMPNHAMSIRWQTHRYLLGQSYRFYQNEFAGRIATKMMQTATATRDTVSKLLDVLLYISIYFIGMVSLVASADSIYLLPFGIWLGCYSSLLFYFIPRLRKAAAKQADAQSIMTGRVVDSYTNFSTIKLFSHTLREANYAREGMQGFLNAVRPVLRLITQLNVAIWLLNAFLIFTVAALSIHLWQLGLVSAGAITIAISLTLRLNGMAQWVMWEVSSLFQNIGTVQDGISTLSQPQAVVDQADARTLDVSQGEIQFNHVGFTYGNQPAVINNLSLKIKPGEKIGLVGPSGAGKSTLASLLLRFHDIESGSITIDGQNIADVSQESLRATIGMVSQDTSLLHRSIKENIGYGHPTATDADIIDAAKKAHADEFIQTLSDGEGRQGYDVKVGERGIKLSGGQRQRIAIARVLLKDAPILILDEATSALDSEVESAIQSNLNQLMQNKTVIAIAHRLSTIAEMDRLIVLDNGAIVEEGSHTELLNKKGVYAQLWQRQSGGFIAD